MTAVSSGVLAVSPVVDRFVGPLHHDRKRRDVFVARTAAVVRRGVDELLGRLHAADEAPRGGECVVQLVDVGPVDLDVERAVGAEDRGFSVSATAICVASDAPARVTRSSAASPASASVSLARTVAGPVSVTAGLTRLATSGTAAVFAASSPVVGESPTGATSMLTVAALSSISP